MTWYRRVRQPGGTYFFTVVTFGRRPLFDDRDVRALLRTAIEQCRRAQPFSLDAICLMPDHLHAVWTLPEGDSDYSTRWGRIKGRFSRDFLVSEGAWGKPRDAWGKPHPTQGEDPSHTTVSRARKGEVTVWQRRFWEHLIRDDEDYRRHVEYIHYNPVKHGFASSPAEWAWSSFHRFVRDGRYDPTWGTTEPGRIRDMNRE